MKTFPILIIILMAAPATAGEDVLRAKIDEASAQGTVLDDGPHVYRRSDSTATVIYYKLGQLVWKHFEAADTLRFRGFGSHDGEIEYTLPPDPPGPTPYQFDGVSRFMALSDIHGDFDPFINLLRNAGVMDRSDGWAWGDGHLVINGDVFDRGADVTECLWLIYRLQQEAAMQGGAVHYLLGNHELMVIRGDLRYIHDSYIKGITGHTGIDYDELFGPCMELGRWLRTLPAAVRIDSTLFVHGGIPPGSIMEPIPLEEMNSLAGSGLDLSSVELKFSEPLKRLYGGLGPFWYRGYHYGIQGYYPEATRQEVEDILDFYDVRHIVVGHSERDSLTALYDGSIFAIDVPVDELEGQQALLFEEGAFYRVDPDGSRSEIR